MKPVLMLSITVLFYCYVVLDFGYTLQQFFITLGRIPQPINCTQHNAGINLTALRQLYLTKALPVGERIWRNMFFMEIVVKYNFTTFNTVYYNFYTILGQGQLYESPRVLRAMVMVQTNTCITGDLASFVWLI